jgi:hypothetical protein
VDVAAFIVCVKKKKERKNTIKKYINMDIELKKERKKDFRHQICNFF